MSIECVKCGPIKPSEGTYDDTCSHCGSRVIREDEPRGMDAIREHLAHRVAELEREVEELKDQNGDLAAGLRDAEVREGRLRQALEPFARAWERRKPKGEPFTKAYELRLERALGVFYSNGNADDRALSGEHLRNAARAYRQAEGGE